MKNNNPKIDQIITALYNWVTTFKGEPVIRDTTKISHIGRDFYIDSNVTHPLSCTVFEMSDKGELIIDKPQRVIESKAAFFLFVNIKTGWISAVKNTTENQKKLVREEPLQNLKVKIIP